MISTLLLAAAADGVAKLGAVSAQVSQLLVQVSVLVALVARLWMLWLASLR